MLKFFRFLTIVVALALGSGIALGGVVDFATLTGSNGDVFTTYTENNFTVTSTTGSWFKAFNFGNPIPDIFLGPVGSPPPGSITVTFAGGLFSFASVDLASNNGTSAYSITGLKGGIQQFNQSGTQATGSIFSTLASSSSLAIDTLVIGITPSGTSFNIDNIVGNATVPEPGTLGLLCCGGLLGGAILRKRATKA